MLKELKARIKEIVFIMLSLANDILLLMEGKSHHIIMLKCIIMCFELAYGKLVELRVERYITYKDSSLQY